MSLSQAIRVSKLCPDAHIKGIKHPLLFSKQTVLSPPARLPSLMQQRAPPLNPLNTLQSRQKVPVWPVSVHRGAGVLAMAASSVLAEIFLCVFCDRFTPPRETRGKRE